MLRGSRLHSAVRVLVVLFACVQLSPGALARCLSHDGSISIGCQCSGCGTGQTVVGKPGHACGCCPAPVFHASTTDGCGNCEVVTADSGECCEHIAIEYNLRNAQIVLPAPVLVAYVCAAAFETANMLPRSADSVQPPAHAPPGLGSSPPELGAAPLPLRI